MTFDFHNCCPAPKLSMKFYRPWYAKAYRKKIECANCGFYVPFSLSTSLYHNENEWNTLIKEANLPYKNR